MTKLYKAHKIGQVIDRFGKSMTYPLRSLGQDPNACIIHFISIP